MPPGIGRLQGAGLGSEMGVRGLGFSLCHSRDLRTVNKVWPSSDVPPPASPAPALHTCREGYPSWVRDEGRLGRSPGR